MAYAAWKTGRHEEPSIFEMFFRKAPFKGKFAIFTGHDEIFRFLEEYKFTDDHLKYLQQAIPHAEPEFFQWLKNLDCSKIKIYGANDGEMVFPE